MTLEAILAYLHLLAILTMVVFLTSEAALCRMQWLNAAVLERPAKVDLIHGIAAVALRASGALPAEGEVRRARRFVLIQAHLIALIPLAAVFLARGYGK